MGAAEEATIAAGTSAAALMEAAGTGAAEIIKKAWSPRPVCVLCGSGNNGGDGFVIARLLHDAGWSVRALMLGDQKKVSSQAALNADLYPGEIEPLSPTSLTGAGLIIDALFGIGLNRNIEGEGADLISRVNAHPAPVVSIDVPSGIRTDTGQPLGIAVKADRTITFFRKKLCHVLMPGKLYCGVVDVVDIGIPDTVMSASQTTAIENHPALWGRSLPRPQPGDHKYHRGSVFAVSGALHQTGASRLAARAALRAGAGLVTVLSPREAAAVNAAHLTSIMIGLADNDAELKDHLAQRDQYRRVCLIGPACGVGEDTKARTLAALESSSAVVVDADALTSFRESPDELFAAIREEDVLTPHDGEFVRLFPDLNPGVDKL